MLFKRENDNDCFYLCTSADWECVVLASDANEASRKAIQFGVDELETDFMVSPCLRVKKIDSEFENSDELFRIDQIFADIGMYKKSLEFSKFIERISK